jgi:ATP-dependent RNA helicase RhlE
MQFHELGLRLALLDAVQAMGYKEATPIQEKAIPLLLAGRDVIGSAQTGTGKTAAFALPIIHQIGAHGPGPRCLVLEPTRELAAQTEENFKKFAKYTNLKISVVFGGVGYGKQRDELKAGADIVVATPGRLLDHIQEKLVDLSGVKHLVLDEADRMLDMGFLPDVKRIIDKCGKNRQTALFSATIPAAIETLIQWAMKSPETIEIGARRSPADTVKHVLYPVAERQKKDLLRALLDHVHYESVLIFCRTRRRADDIEALLKRNEHRVAAIHSDRSQVERERALAGFKSGKYEVLVATDIASRGLDIADVTHVINYDVPQHPEDYVHRIGRTGRAKASGDAFTLMVAEDSAAVRAIERYIGNKVERVKLPNFNYDYSNVFDEGKPGVGALAERKVKGVRLTGGYYFGPAKKRR